MQIWALTDPGNLRPQNQDAYETATFGFDRALLVVCDGMGGARAGNVASELAVAAFTAHVRASQKGVSGAERIFSMLREALARANRAVYERAQTGEEYAGMGTTLVAAFIVKNTAYLINVGDSRAYHFSLSGVRQITQDHSLVQMMVLRGELTPEQAKNFPGKNLITRAVGTEPEVEGDVFLQELRKDECLLLCSDGLSNEMADQEMLFEVAHGQRRSDCCQRLMHIAKHRGAPDNVTLVLASM